MQEPVAVNEITGIISFLYTIDWSEPWLWFLMAMHVFCCLCTYSSIALKSMFAQTTLFCIYLIPVYCMEYVNEWAAKNYKLFSNEQYFDDKGLFISLLVSAPLLLNGLVFIFVWLHEAYKMLARVQVARSKSLASREKQTNEKKLGEEKVKDWLDKKDD